MGLAASGAVFAAAPADSPSQIDGQIPRSGPCQAKQERVAKALFRGRPNLIGRIGPEARCPAKNAPVAQLDRAPDYESGGQEFESLRARQHLATTYRAKIIGLLRDLQGSSVRKWTLVTAIRR